MCPLNCFIGWTSSRILFDIFKYPTCQFRYRCLFFFARRPLLVDECNQLRNYSRIIPASLYLSSFGRTWKLSPNSVYCQLLNAHIPLPQNVAVVFPANSHNNWVAFLKNRFHNVLFFYAFLIRCQNLLNGWLYLICFTKRLLETVG